MPTGFASTPLQKNLTSICLLGLTLLLLLESPPGMAAAMSARQREAEEEVVRLAALAQQRYNQRRYVEEVTTDAFAVRALERAYGPLHPRVIEHLGKVLIKHGGHGVTPPSLSLASLMLDKLEAIPGVPKEVLPGYAGLVVYFQWAADSLAAPNRPFIKRALTFLAARLGPDHPDVKTLRDYAFGGRWSEKPMDEAFDLLDQLITETPDILRNIKSEVESTQSRAPMQEALNRAIAHWEGALGPDHMIIGIFQMIKSQDLMSSLQLVEALAAAEKALSIFERRRISNPAARAETMLMVALIYSSAGGTDKAEKLVARALDILDRYPGEHWRAGLAINATVVAGFNFAGRQQFDEALKISDAVIDLTRESQTLTGKAALQRAKALRMASLFGLKRYAESITAIEEFLALESNDVMAGKFKAQLTPSMTLALAHSQLRNGNPDAAAAALAKAEPLVSANGFDRAMVLGLRAELANRLGNRQAAILLGKLAINQLQALRGNVARFDGTFEQGFVKTHEETYLNVANILIDAGRLAEAQQVLAMIKDKEFDDFVTRAAPTPTSLSLTAQEQEWEGRFRGVSTQVAALGSERDRLRNKTHRGEALSEEENQRRERLDQDLKSARAAFEKYLADMLNEFGKGDAERGMEVGEKNLGALRALQGTLRRLGHGAVVVHYLVTPDKVRILLTTPDVQLARESGVTQAELNRKIQAFRQAVGTPSGKHLALAKELHQLLIAPIQADLDQASAQTLMLSLDGSLRYVPMAALHDGERHLVERYRLTLYTEAARDKLKDAPAPVWRFAGLGLTRAVPGFSPLPSVREELEGIIKRGDRGVLDGEIHLDQAFNQDRLRATLDKGFPVVHVASHFVFQPGTDIDSYLLLGDGSKFSLRDFRESDFSLAEVDLFTLSACDTANFGGRDANGREVEGLGTMLQKQGARSVIATLWPVADESTGIFMQELYRQRQVGKLNKAEALRQTQLAFAKSTLKPAARQDLSHPFFWAPFILMGNWL